MKRSLVLLCVSAVAGCTQPPSQEPSIGLPSQRWYQHEPTKVDISWTGITECSGNGWGRCDTIEPPPTFHVVSATCSGCKLTVPDEDATGAMAIGAEATTDDVIDIDVVVESDGARYDLTAQAQGDHEVGVSLHCNLETPPQQIGTSTVSESLPCGSSFPSGGYRVWVTPAIVSAHGDERFPFCNPSDGGGPCPAGSREVSSIQSSPAETWTSFGTFEVRDRTLGHLTVTAPLDTGDLVSSTIQIPTAREVVERVPNVDTRIAN